MRGAFGLARGALVRADAVLALRRATGAAARSSSSAPRPRCCWSLNVAPRLGIAVAAVCFLSFIGAAQDFAGYQSDGMLLEAAFISLFLAPRGLRPGLGAARPAVAARGLPAASGSGSGSTSSPAW